MTTKATSLLVPNIPCLFQNVSDATAAGQIKEAADVGYVAREFYSGELRWVTADAPLHISHRPRPAHCAGMDPEIINFALYCVAFELWALAPLPLPGGGGSWVLLGEVDKYHLRVISIQIEIPT